MDEKREKMRGSKERRGERGREKQRRAAASG